ncbi:MAG: tetratricopeptide repeat-containing diguanylate cyclase [Bellilinea sp.]
MFQSSKNVSTGGLSPEALAQKVDAYLHTAELFSGSDPQHALNLARQALEMLGHTNLAEVVPADIQGGPEARRVLGRALLLEGRACVQMESYDQAIPLFLKALECFVPGTDDALIATALNGLGSGYLVMGAYPEALQHLLRALTIYRQLKDVTGEAATLSNVGRLYLLLDDAPKALSHLEQALDLAERTSDRALEAEVHVNLCNALRMTGQNRSAGTHGLRSVEIYQELAFHAGEAEALSSVGDLYLEMGDYTQALNFLQLTAEVSQKIGRRKEVARALRRIGTLHLREGRIEMALGYLQRALEAADEAEAKREHAKCHAALTDVYKQLGDFEQALDHFEKFYLNERLLFDEESDRRLKTIETIHQVENARKDSEIYQLRNVELQQEVEERKRAQAALEHLATIDTLTGLANRRYFLELAERAFYQAQRYNRPLSVVMIDVDNFKHINDTFGHAAGDQVLRAVSSRMQAVLRRSDILGRYGGDEFVVLLPETGQEGARRMTERLRASVAMMGEEVGSIDAPVSLSIGLASTFSMANITLDALLQYADKALYTSKQAGRDRVTAYEADLRLTSDLPVTDKEP